MRLSWRNINSWTKKNNEKKKASIIDFKMQFIGTSSGIKLSEEGKLKLHVGLQFDRHIDDKWYGYVRNTR